MNRAGFDAQAGRLTQHPVSANGKPHALQSLARAYSASYGYDLNGNAISAGASAGAWRSMALTSFNLPDGTGGIQGAAATPRYT